MLLTKIVHEILPIDPVKIYDQATLEKDGYFESRVDMSGHCSTHIDTLV